jgi:hypothetical protein
LFFSQSVIYTADWELPYKGLLEFDYCSTYRPPADAKTMSDEEFYGAGVRRDKTTGKVASCGAGGFWDR